MIDYSLEHEIDNYLARLFPLPRSITGNGNRETLSILQELAPINILEFASGKRFTVGRSPMSGICGKPGLRTSQVTF